MSRSILERERELAELGVAAREAKAGNGSIVLIEGEAGIGKSSLVDAIRSVLPAEGRLMLGYCDDLATPRVLGPLRDLRDSVGTSLTAALDSGDRSRVLDALRAELDGPTIRPCWSSKTCTGPTRPHWMSCGSWFVGSARCRPSWC
jgi:predicted ATPase